MPAKWINILCTAILGIGGLQQRPGWAQAPAPSGSGLSAHDYGDDALLGAWLWTHNPEVIDARSAVRAASAETTRSQLLPNPSFDATWGTIPLGATNPPALQSPLTSVPYYSLGVSQPFEIGKRQPRKNIAIANVEVAQAQARDSYAARFFDLLESIGRIAQAQSRATAYEALVAASEGLLKLQRARASKGDIAVLDLTRAEVEQQRLLVAQSTVQLEMAQAQADCATIAATECQAFASGDAARAWLRKVATMPLPQQWSSEVEARRADFRALAANSRAAHALVEFGRAMRLPDVAARLGYTYDQFTVSGNQAHSLALSLQIGLPVFSHGQADLQAAAGQLERVQAVRLSRTVAGRLALQAAGQRRQLSLSRALQIEEALAKAADVLAALTEAMRRGSASLGDVLMARRAHQELLLERLELDTATFAAVLDARKAAALYPAESQAN